MEGSPNWDRKTIGSIMWFWRKFT